MSNLSVYIFHLLRPYLQIISNYTQPEKEREKTLWQNSAFSFIHLSVLIEPLAPQTAACYISTARLSIRTAPDFPIEKPRPCISAPDTACITVSAWLVRPGRLTRFW